MRYSHKNVPLFELLERRYFLTAALDIYGVQPAALDQPRVHVLLRQSPGGDPISASDDFGDTSFDIQAFLDTGTSANLLSQETASELNLGHEITADGQDVFYYDTGVAGDEAFNVSDPYYTGIAPFSPLVDGTAESDFSQNAGPFRFELNPIPVDDPDLTDPLDIVGMPVMQGKVVVMDPKPVDNIDYMNTYLYDPGTPFRSDTADTDPGIPTTSYHVKMSYSDFSRFTFTDPPGDAPNSAPNPMIGPDPVAQLDGTPTDSTPPVTIGEGNFTGSGSFLFDTGAAASFISTAMAAKVHVHYDPATIDGDTPTLVDDSGNPIPDQFILQIGGTSDTVVNAAGFFLDTLTLQTAEGTPIVFHNAPVLVSDITVTDPNTGDALTLDGDFGMNFLVASVSITASDTGGDFGDARGTPFSWVVFDQSTGTLGFEPAPDDGTGGLFSATIVNAQTFYNNSVFDGFNAGVSTADGITPDDMAIAQDKVPLLPGQTATFANYTTSTKGINGLIVDMFLDANPDGITANDFEFRVGNNNDPTTWQTVSVQPTVVVRAGAEESGFVDRIVITFPDGAITGQWLQVRVLADDNTGLSVANEFYFGNAPGETGNSATDAAVSTADVLGTRSHMTTSDADVLNRYDFDRNGAVNIADVLAARGNQTAGAGVLNLITAPPGVGPPPPISDAATRPSAFTATYHTIIARPAIGRALSLIAPAASAPSITVAALQAAPVSNPVNLRQPPVKLPEATVLQPPRRRVGELFSRSLVRIVHAVHPPTGGVLFFAKYRRPVLAPQTRGAAPIKEPLAFPISPTFVT